ncbi:haloacid dehalogenase type II [Streptomyces genisteinicus]|uniref:Haloacid dehalogenase type II n=1 Tax=Streptomyces genisteinicus TaxID=2768068 RepID=A0A7H0HXY9_9ACTN|nr:haloacid dehalogenase type II [Streptomyces genisteinicus]QNP65405.1 haloacid dehalogenase type II [Streptomyces genisteinicus]
MDPALRIEVAVFDVLGTMVDQPGGLRTAVREALAPGDETSEDRLLAGWAEYVAREERRIANGERPYADSAALDREAAERMTGDGSSPDPRSVERLATANQRLAPWADSLGGLAALARLFPVVGLSNASRATLLRLNAHTGLRWHQALSAEDVRAFKPAKAVYRLALDTAACPPERTVMIAAHAWDLRGAQALGMRTAYVHRPGGDPPRDTDTFDWRADGLEELAAVLAPFA